MYLLVNSSVTSELIIVVITAVISRVRVMDTASDVVQEDIPTSKRKININTRRKLILGKCYIVL